VTRLESLLSFVPDILRERVRGGESPRARVEHIDGVVLASDVSGFATLAISLRDTAGGVEELSSIINGSFAHLINVIDEAGGDVLGFAGDALTAYWPAGSDAAVAAGWAALEAQHRLAQDARVKIRIGLESGSLALWTVGGEADRWFLTLSGGAPATAAALQAKAELGQVAVSEAFIAAADGRARTTMTAAGVHRLDGIDGTPVPGPPREPVDDDKVDDATLTALRRYVGGSVIDRVLAGHHHFLSELRTVTILMLRTPGREDPSELTELQDVMLTVQRCAYRYGGTIELGVDEKGITFMVTFGIPPLAHEDDVDRALSAAHAIDHELTGAGIEHGIGIATGLAYCGTLGGEVRRQPALLSDVSCTAARLAAAGCDPDRPAVLYETSTADAARPRWTFAAPHALRLKGRAELTTAFSRADRVTRSGLATASIVGRDKELDRILGLALAEPEHRGGRLILVEGDLGAGKSSLLGAVQEALKQEGRRARVGFADSLERSAPLRAWSAVFADLLDVEGLDRSEVADHLRVRVGPLAPLLSPVLALDLPETEESQALSGEQRMLAARSLLLELLADDRGEEGALFLLEDAQWFDSASWALLVDVLALSGITTIATSRPVDELTARQLGRVKAAMSRIRLEPLAPDQVGDLASLRLGVDQIDPRVQDLLVERCRGNPYFIVEVVKTLVQRGAVVVRDGRARLVDDTMLEVPGSIQAAITAVVDDLSADQQLTLKVASVIGSPFTDPVLAEIHPTRRPRPLLTEDLGLLIDRELVDPDARSVETYEFHHELIREASYGLMVTDQRRTLHRALAEFYEANVSDRDQLYPVLAHHWLRAEDDAKAVQYLALAAVSSIANGMPRESVMQGVQAARLLGIELETDASKIVELLPGELAEIERLMAGRRPADLATLPELVDPDITTGIGIVLQSMPAAFQNLQTELFGLMAIRNLNLTLRFGAGPLAACVYAMYSIVLRGLGAGSDVAYEFSELARTVDVAAAASNAAVVNFVHVWFNNHWRNPYATSIPTAMAGAEVGLSGNDLLYGCFNLAAATTLHAHSGTHLDEVIAIGQRHLEQIGGRSSTAAFHNRLEAQVAKALSGRTTALDTLTCDDCDEEELSAMLQTENFNQSGFYHVAKLRLLYLAGRPRAALASAELAEQLLPAFTGQVGQIDLVVYSALAQLADLPEDPTGRTAALELVRERLVQLDMWAAGCPRNFADKAALVRGELLAAEGDVAAAEASFAAAEEHAQGARLPQWAALARERRGHAARAAGVAASAHFAAAAMHYTAWGAAAKAGELETLAATG
jgi:predicted ATPase